MARTRNGNGSWTSADSLDLYNVAAWGSGYFSVNAAGHVVVRPDTTEAHEIDLYEVVEGLKERDLAAPVVIRFSDILAHRLRHLHDAFEAAHPEIDLEIISIPWGEGATTLEWTLPSPPPFHQFNELPVIKADSDH